MLAPGRGCASQMGAAIARGGDADPDCPRAIDYRAAYGLYGNGICNAACAQPDPDCSVGGSESSYRRLATACLIGNIGDGIHG